MLTIEPTITKEFLLKAHPEEQYMSYYLGVPITKKLFKSPLRVDHRETCSFYKNDKTGLRYKDFGNGVNYGFIDVVMHRFNCTYHKALRIIASDFNLINTRGQDKVTVVPDYKGTVLNANGPCDIKVEVKEFTIKELEWWQGFGINKQLLEEGSVYSLKSVFLNNVPSFFSSDKCPIYGYFLGHEDNRELWKIYFPTKIKYRFLLNTSKLQGVHMLPKKADLIIITKSMKDVLTLRSHGYYAVAPQSENSYPKKEQMEAIAKRFNHILVFLDNDRAGLKAMSALRKMYRVKFFAIPHSHKVKDISDFHKKYGAYKTQAFLANLNNAIVAGELDYHLTKHDQWQKK
jgi:hypothetical protein